MIKIIDRDVIALGTSLALISLMLVTMIILLLLFGVYHCQTSRAEIDVYKFSDVECEA